MVSINFFRTLTINQRIAVIQEHFFQEKCLHISKNSELCGVLICTVRIPASLTLNSLQAWEKK